MPINEQGEWCPPISAKQAEILNCNKKFLLVHGPRYSSKTIGIMHKIIHHAWSTPGAIAGMFAKFSKTGKIGVWSDLVDSNYGAIQGWMDCPGFEITKKPSMDPNGKMVHMKIRNWFGGESEIQLHSINNMDEIEDKVKSSRFSLVYGAELSNFNDERIFRATRSQLRMPHLRDDQHQWIGDTNPDEQGEDSWIWKIWLDPEVKEQRGPDSNYHDIQVMIDDNPFLTDDRKAEIFEEFSYDPDILSRYYYGKWVAVSKNSHFSGIFKKEIHVIGSARGPSEEDWEIILPSKKCEHIISGWDPGDTNHSAQLIEKVEKENGQYYYAVLDELVIINKNMSLEEFTELFMEKVNRIIRFTEDQNPDYRHWSDASAINRYRSSANSFDNLIISAASNGVIQLQASPKGAGSQERRVRAIKKLLMTNRLFISANCEETIKSLMYLKKGKGPSNYIAKGPRKHAFDSLSYALVPEMMNDLENVDTPETGRVSEDQYVSIDLL
jgi:hypothetical protein